MNQRAMHDTVIELLKSDESREFIRACFRQPGFARERILVDAPNAKRRRITESLKLRHEAQKNRLRRNGVKV